MTGILLAMLLGTVPLQTSSPVSLVVVANPGVPVDNLSLGELRRIFMSDRQFWSQGLRVTVLVPPPASREGQVLLKKVYEKTESQYRHYWIAKVFRAEVAAAPKTVASDELALALVREIEGAISVVDATKIPRGVKSLKVDGKSAADADYPLR